VWVEPRYAFVDTSAEYTLQVHVSDQAQRYVYTIEEPLNVVGNVPAGTRSKIRECENNTAL